MRWGNLKEKSLIAHQSGILVSVAGSKMQDLHTNEVKVATQITSWPSPQDYNEAIQNPQFAFNDPELNKSEPELNIIGLPKPASGNFASVYRMYSDASEWAVRCFLQPMSDQQQRYEALSRTLKECKLPYMCNFEYLTEGIRVHNQWYPIIKMEWVKGKPLLDYISEHIDNSERVSELAASFDKMVQDLRVVGIAHGDLQHGNILVTDDGQIKLVDYDGCFVPSLQGKTSNELGHRNYQHPKRDATYFHERMDVFSAQTILLSLQAISADPSLWTKLNAGDECLLFRRQDFIKPEFSRAFHLLEIQHNDTVKMGAKQIRYELGLDLTDLPEFGETSQLSGLPPLEAILHGSASEHYAHRMSSEPSAIFDFVHVPKKNKNPANERQQRIVSILGIVLLVFAASELQRWTVKFLDKFVHEQTIYSATSAGRQSVDNLVRAVEYNHAAETGQDIVEETYETTETALKDYQEANLNRYKEPELARQKFLRALKLDSQGFGHFYLSLKQRADALQFIGISRLKENDASSVSYIEEAYDLLVSSKLYFEASTCIAEYADTLLEINRFEDSYAQAILALENRHTDKMFYRSLASCATHAAIGTFKNDACPTHGKLLRIWNAVRRFDDINLDLTILAEADEFAESLYTNHNYKAAREIFGFIATVSTADDFMEFRQSANKRLRELSNY